MGGAIVDSGTFDWAQNDKYPSLAQPEEAYHGLNFYESFGDLAYTTYGHAVGLRDLGPTMAPMNAYLTIMGIETLALRMEKHVANAEVVANYLHNHAKVSWVSYAGLEESNYFHLAKKYLPNSASIIFFWLIFIPSSLYISYSYILYKKQINTYEYKNKNKK